MNQKIIKNLSIILFGLALVVTSTGCGSPNKWPPAPNAGFGVVIGKLVTSSQTGFQFTPQDLYLGRLIAASQPNMDPAVSFTYGEDPGTTVRNPDGTFAFTNITPGTYTILIWTPGNSFVIEAPTGGLIKVVVEKDKVTDLGTVTLP